jgi:DNA-binding NarL/FixJ family response regulator
MTDLAHDLGPGQLDTGHPDEVPDHRVIFDDEDAGGGCGHVPLLCSIPGAGSPLKAEIRLSREKMVAVFHVFVVDGQAVVLEAVRLLCAEHGGLEFAGGASSVPEAARTLDEVSADVLLIDLELPASLELVRTARSRWPRTAVLAMHDGTAPERLQQAMSMGAMGIVEKSAEISELTGAIRRAATGGPRTHGAAAAPAGADEKDVPLSPRERAVLSLLAAGRSNQEIATELGISPRTVASHVASIYRRLQVETRIEAATAAIRLGIASGSEADSDT